MSYTSTFQLKDFFDFSKKLEAIIPKILNELCDRNLANSLPRNGTVGCEKASEQLEAHQVEKYNADSISTLSFTK